MGNRLEYIIKNNIKAWFKSYWGCVINKGVAEHVGEYEVA